VRPEVWTFLSSTIVTIGGLLAVWFQNRKQHNENKTVSAEIKEQVAPVSNGFAAGVRDDLAALRATLHSVSLSQNRVERRLDDHMADHAGTPRRRRAA
jgi:zinc transporter ZupT